MVFFPNCKINLGLKILRRRTDGYHDLSTIFYPLPLKDILELIRLPDDATPAFSAYGLPIPGDPDTNLCLKAWRLLKQDFPDLPPVHIYLYKQIPIGAGLGGGSSNGAFTLMGLNQQFHLGLTQDKLLHYASQLGSDCPFFIVNTPSIGGGRGEQLHPIDLDLSHYIFVLVDPGIHISTARAFSGCTPAENPMPLENIVRLPVAQWADLLANDFEAPIFLLHPELRAIKQTLYTHGALYASLTGSGSSFFGIFEKDSAPTISPFHGKYIYRILP